MNFAGSKAVSTIRHVIVDQLTLGNSAEKIKNFINLGREQVDILEFRETTEASGSIMRMAEQREKKYGNKLFLNWESSISLLLL